jgi:hypothetical protein
MITNDGKELIGKFLLGQAPSYATHLAFGCGATPGDKNYAQRKGMKFEMFRVPISSKGFVNDKGITKIAFSAELPTEEKFEITEVALWSAGHNALALNSDSRLLFGFGAGENWKLHTPTGVQNILEQYSALNAGITANPISGPAPIFITNADNVALQTSPRKERHEGTRYLNRTIMFAGNSTDHIHLDGRTVNLTENTPNDEIKIALCVFSALDSNATPPAQVNVEVEFLASELDDSVGFAKLTARLTSADLAAGRYVIITKKLSELEYSPQFSWSDVQVTRISANANNDPNYFVAMDAIRFENMSQPNPLYVMTGYAVTDIEYRDNLGKVFHKPISKMANTSNYVEFRFSLGVT